MVKYSLQKLDTNMARAMVVDAEISLKKSREICDFFRYKTTSFTKKYLEAVLEKKLAIPFKKHNAGAGHKPGMGPGKYPTNAAKKILSLIKAVEANAKQKGLGDELKIIHISAKSAARPLHYGRFRGMNMKRSHVEVVVKEIITKEKKAKGKEKEKGKPKEKPKPAAAEAKKTQEKKEPEKKAVEQKVVPKETPKTAPTPKPIEKQPQPSQSTQKSKPIQKPKPTEQKEDKKQEIPK
jgi:large subunit ribosomal protein L22